MLATMRSVSLSIFLYYKFFCKCFVNPWALHSLILIGDFVLEGILKLLAGLSLFTLVFPWLANGNLWVLWEISFF